MAIDIRPVAEPDIREFITWRYEPPYDGYNITGDAEELVAYFTLASVDCHSLFEDDELIGFCTFGSDAQVPGGDYFQNRLDIGLGIRPDLTGKGNGSSYVKAVVNHALTKQATLRATIAQQNLRAIRVWEANGFARTQACESPSVVMGTDRFAIYERG